MGLSAGRPKLHTASLYMAGPPVDAAAQIIVAMFNSTDAQSNNNTAILLNMTGAEPKNCLFGTKSVSVNGKSFRVSDEQCTVLGAGMKMKNYYVSLGDSGGKTELIRLQASTIVSESAYESSLPIFEEIMKTVKITK